MRFVVRLAPLLCFSAGCGFAQKPYADDPLLRGGRAVWSSRDPIASAPPAPLEPVVIEPPPAPEYKRRSVESSPAVAGATDNTPNHIDPLRDK
jgi:hypothetical protein